MGKIRHGHFWSQSIDSGQGYSGPVLGRCLLVPVLRRDRRNCCKSFLNEFLRIDRFFEYIQFWRKLNLILMSRVKKNRIWHEFDYNFCKTCLHDMTLAWPWHVWNKTVICSVMFWSSFRHVTITVKSRCCPSPVWQEREN